MSLDSFTFFCKKKNLTWAPYEHANTVLRRFSMTTQTLLENFEGFSRFERNSQKKVLICVYTSNCIAIIQNLCIYSKEKNGCQRSHWLCWRPIFKLCDQISLRKRKISWNRFSLFILGPGRIFWGKICFLRNFVTLSL